MATATKSGKMPHTRKKTSKDAAQRELVAAFRGSMRDLRLSVDEYLREKYAATDAENAR